jgi:hypothetical protein
MRESLLIFSTESSSLPSKNVKNMYKKLLLVKFEAFAVHLLGCSIFAMFLQNAGI